MKTSFASKQAILLIGITFGVIGLEGVESKETKLNFSEHIAPIIFNNCTTCHREGEGTPFTFMNYNEVKKRGRLIAKVTESRFMPPWHAESGDYKFQGERRLTDKQIAMLAQWVEEGMTEGDSRKLPPLPEHAAGWQLGKPDLVVKMTEPYPVPAGGRDIYRSFVIPLDIKETKWVKAVAFKPGAPSVVHHSLFRYDTTGNARRLDARTSTPGFTGMGRGGRGVQSLGGWAVGGTPKFLPEGLAFRLPAGSDLVMDMHFHQSGKPEEEVSTVGFYFDDKPPTSAFTGIQMPPVFGAMSRVDIPAGQNDYTVKDSFEIPIDVEAFAISSHAHYLGKELKMTATFPDGQRKELFWIKNWDFSWQEQYNYTEFVSLPKGTRLDATVIWDNSAENPNNPSSPPRRVRWGLQSTDEMGSMTLLVKPKKSRDLSALRSAMVQHAREHATQRALQSRGRSTARIPRERPSSSTKDKNGTKRPAENEPQQKQNGGQKLVDSAMQGDRNKNGKISRSEAPTWLRRSFSKIDKNSDGELDRKELEAVLLKVGGSR